MGAHKHPGLSKGPGYKKDQHLTWRINRGRLAQTKEEKMQGNEGILLNKVPSPQIDLNSLSGIKCECGGSEFTQIFLIKYIPPILSKDGSPGCAFAPKGFRCNSCQKDYSMKDFLSIAKTMASFSSGEAGQERKVD